MKKMFFCIVVSVLLLASCADPPLEFRTTTNAEKYLQTNWYVEQTLADSFHSSLPLLIPMNCKNVDYYYNYSCKGFGDPCFTIDLSLVYVPLEEYNKEKERISKIHFNESQKNELTYFSVDDLEYFVISPTEYRLQQYLDKEILDGLDFKIEIVVFNNFDQKVRYISSLQWDGQEKEYRIKEVVSEIINQSINH